MLVNEFNSILELRVDIEYGHYLAMACNDSKKLQKSLGPNGEDNGYFDWNPIRWQQITSGYLGEETEGGKRKQVRLQLDSSILMDWTESIDRASKISGYGARTIGYQSLAYADRYSV